MGFYGHPVQSKFKAKLKNRSCGVAAVIVVVEKKIKMIFSLNYYNKDLVTAFHIFTFYFFFFS